ncbi:hypothetical protein H6F76_15660 [Leptolyngbya sp. FACHB-321]|uniref:hypothetical protein n=1 Tax=Leptolyngbya sp. FACHB-321 TaxID=2692807 RepID=UPI00168663BC|nr:hypothetical protein [Leptolyngbya sp. FACHB-321]MBD2036449.1 hypothetical protein [Leptolyngbya sp. FACHB-321]
MTRNLQRKATSFEFQGLTAAHQSLLGLTLMEVVLMVCGLMLLCQPQLTTLECDRRQAFGRCKLVVSSLSQETAIPLPLERLEKADVQHHGRFGQLVLHTADGRFSFPINRGFSSTQDAANQVNTFVQDAAMPSLKLKQDNRGFVYPLALCLLGMGSSSLWFSCRGWLKHFTRES